MNRQSRARAIVLGGSITRVLAARVLADFYGEVLVLDKGKVLGVKDSRRGTPHTHHAHGLHGRVHLIFEELFPGFTQELASSGVPTGDLGKMRWFFNGRRLQPARTGLVAVTALRPVLEEHVRARVADLPNVRFMEQRDILALAATPDRKRIIGVRVEYNSEPELLEGDLVIDATGPGLAHPCLAGKSLYRRPSEGRIKVNLAYTTRPYAYLARLQYAASKDPEVTKGFMRVAGLVDPPQALMRPGIALRVLRHSAHLPPTNPQRRPPAAPPQITPTTETTERNII